MTKQTLTYFACSVALMLAVVGLHSYAADNNPPAVKFADVQYAADFSDDRILMGAAHNVFVGRVLNEANVTEGEIGVETQYRVQVVDNIKGDLRGTVILNVQGGYKDGVLYAVGDDSLAPADGGYLPQTGATYLFATRYNPDKDWHTLIAYPTAKRLISSDRGLSDPQLKGLAQDDGRYKQLKSVYPKEILLEADLKANNTRNSYKTPIVKGPRLTLPEDTR